MKNTERLLGIALAVLALEGCRGPQQQARLPGPQPSASASPSHGGHAHGGYAGHGTSRFAAGYAAGAAAGTLQSRQNQPSAYSRTLGRGGANRSSGGWGGFGRSGFSGGWHGFGGGFGHSGGFGG